MSIREKCEHILSGIDEDILEYIVSMIEDQIDDLSEISEGIAGFILSSEFTDSEEAAQKYCDQIIQAVQSDAASVTPLSDEPQLLKNKLVISKESAELLPPPPKKEEVVTSFGRADIKSGSKSKSSRKTAAAARVYGQALELEEELEAARVYAARARTRDGAFNGALEMNDFNLENPGGGAPLLENASCTLVRGRRYGLIGRNGKGKSTLLRALAARRVGNIPTNVTVHYVSQEVELSDEKKEMTAVQIVIQADIERRLLLEEVAEFEAILQKSEQEGNDSASLSADAQKRYSEVLEQLQLIGADSAERRAVELLENLGFTEALRSRPLKALSGGWRVRTMLAAAIFARPDVLLLDEPTNHLSILAVLWLARELSTNPVWADRIIVIVSHDRYFIDEVCKDVLHISGVAQRLTQSKGNYSLWSSRRAEQQKTYAKEKALQEAEVKKLEDYAGHGFKYGGSSSQINKMQMKAKQAEKLKEAAKEHANDLAALQEDMELPLKIASGGELDGFVIQISGVSFAYPNGPSLFNNVELGVMSNSRICLMGENGNGKTTLVKLMLGELSPTEGEIRRSNQVRFALVNQHHADQIDFDLTPLQYMLEKFPGDGSYAHEQSLRGHLSTCGVTGGDPDLQNVPTAGLSGGQRSRVALAAVSFVKPHVLFLDEPTNNLDLESVSALAEAVKSFKGAVVVVSHDQYFVNQVANEVWVVGESKVKRVASFDAYRKKQLQQLKA